MEAVEDVEGVGGCESAISVCLVISDQKTTTPTMIIELRGFYYNYVTFLESFIESQTE